MAWFGSKGFGSLARSVPKVSMPQAFQMPALKLPSLSEMAPKALGAVANRINLPPNLKAAVTEKIAKAGDELNKKRLEATQAAQQKAKQLASAAREKAAAVAQKAKAELTDAAKKVRAEATALAGKAAGAAKAIGEKAKDKAESMAKDAAANALKDPSSLKDAAGKAADEGKKKAEEAAKKAEAMAKEQVAKAKAEAEKAQAALKQAADKVKGEVADAIKSGAGKGLGDLAGKLGIGDLGGALGGGDAKPGGAAAGALPGQAGGAGPAPAPGGGGGGRAGGELVKLTLKPEKGDEIKVQFNPSEYSVVKSVPWKHHDIDGLDAPQLEFTSGDPVRLGFQLVFDRYEEGKSVREITDKIEKLSLVHQELHRPPVVFMSWGSGLMFKCILERFALRFTHFLEDGTPVRAIMHATFKEFSPPAEQLKGTPRHSPDRTKRRIFKMGDTLSAIAGREYDDPTQWRLIANANRIDDPLAVVPGTELQIPPLIR